MRDRDIGAEIGAQVEFFLSTWQRWLGGLRGGNCVFRTQTSRGISSIFNVDSSSAVGWFWNIL